MIGDGIQIASGAGKYLFKYGDEVIDGVRAFGHNKCIIGFQPILSTNLVISSFPVCNVKTFGTAIRKLLDPAFNGGQHILSPGLSEDLVMLALRGNKMGGAYAAALDDLIDSFNSLVNAGTNFLNYSRLVDDLKKGSNFAEGARWIQKYVTENISEFAGKTLEFELEIILGRVDLKVENILYEFKSVLSLPPGKFAKQMARDLKEADILSDLNWIFDGRKLPNGITQLDKDAMLLELESMVLDEETILKFVNSEPYSVERVIDQIEMVFSQIFKVK